MNENPHDNQDGKPSLSPGLFQRVLFFLLVAGMAVWAGSGGLPEFSENAGLERRPRGFEGRVGLTNRAAALPRQEHLKQAAASFEASDVVALPLWREKCIKQAAVCHEISAAVASLQWQQHLERLAVIFQGRLQPGESTPYRDLAAFRAARLSQPELREPFCTGVLQEILFSPKLKTLAPAASKIFGYGNADFSFLNTEMPGKNTGLMLSQPYTGAGQNRSNIFNTGLPAPGPPPGFRLKQGRIFDLNGDGVQEKYTLQEGVLTVYAGSRLLWQSSESWWVDYFFFGDINNDGLPELNLSVWKEGSFGPRRPFWVTAEDAGVKNHLFTYKLAEGYFKPVWQSSNLDCPNYWAALADLDGDGKNELAVVEGSYVNPLKRKRTFWKWNGWGLSRTNWENAF